MARTSARAPTHGERRALAVIALAATAAIAWIAHPFAAGLLLGALMAFTLEPVARHLERRTGRPVLARLSTVLVAGVLICGALLGFVSVFAARAVDWVSAARERLQDGGASNPWVGSALKWLSQFGVSTASIVSRLESGAGALAERSAAIAGVLATGTFALLLGLFFALLTMYAVLSDWPRIVEALADVSPLDRAHTRELVEEFRLVGRTTISGTALTGLAQGALAMIGYALTGVPEPMFFGVATALASLLPAVGTLLVWVPAGLWLLLTGHPLAGVAELVWGALVIVVFSDYVIRPRLVGDERLPALLVFIALFGGLEVFGLAGVLAGPVIMAVAVAVLRIYARDRAGAQRNAMVSSTHEPGD